MVKVKGNMIEAYRRLLKEMSLRELRVLARKHDHWFGTEKVRKFKIRSAGKGVLISWIMSSYPVFEKGGLVDFLKHNGKHYH